MSTLQELTKISKDMNILCVEDSENFLKQISSLLERLFKNVYKAKSGQEGLDKYKEYHPHVVLTDLTMPNMDGFEMIKILKTINPDIKIIIISAYVDTDNLLEAIHMGVSDFIPKPVDRDLLNNALFKVCSELTARDTLLDQNKLNSQTDIMKQLKTLSEHKDTLEFINHYKGVPIAQKGTLIDCSDSSITVHAPYIQTLAISYEKLTSFDSNYLDYTIEADLESIDPKTREIKLTNIKKTLFSIKKREQVRLVPDGGFKTVAHINNKKYDVVTKDVSIKSIRIIIEKKDISLSIKEQDEVLINMGFKVHHKGGTIMFEDSERVSTKATAFKVNEYKKSLEVVLLFDLEKKHEDLMAKYIMEREMDLIKEFKLLNLERI